MDLNKDQRIGILKAVHDVKITMSKSDAIQKDLTEKVAKLKTLASVSGGNAQAVIDEALKVLGAEVVKLGGFGEE